MLQIIIFLILLAPRAFSGELYSNVYIARTDMTTQDIFRELNATKQMQEEILRLNQELGRINRVPAGTIINLSLYRQPQASTSQMSLKKLKVINNRQLETRFVITPIIATQNTKTSLNNDAEINATSRRYGLGMDIKLSENSFFGWDIFGQMAKHDFSKVQVKQQTGMDKNLTDESRIDYELGLRGIFNHLSPYNRLNFSFSRATDHLYDYSKKKTFYTSTPSDYIDIAEFSTWWMGAELSQSIPALSFPLEVLISYALSVDGRVTSENDSEVRSLKGRRSSVALMWKRSNEISLSLNFQNLIYQSEYSTDINRISLIGSFEL